MKHLLSAKDLTHDEAVMVLDTAEAMAATQSHAVKKLPTLRGKTVVNLFFEDSTRTRLSFEAAAKRLSADVINFSAKGSSLSKGESLKDTAQTIMAMGADAVVVRHSACGAAHLLAHAGWINVPVLNAGDGTHQHPTQALLDAMTLRRWYIPGAPATADGSPAPQGRDLEGARVIIVGDVLHSRVARSNVDLLTALGAQVTLVAPPTLLPVGMDDWPCEVSYNLDEAIEDIRQGRMVLVADDENRENEGDLIVAAAHATADNVNFMARYARGLICAPVSGEIAGRRRLGPPATTHRRLSGRLFALSASSLKLR